MGNCDKCDIEDSDLAPCDTCKVKLCTVCSTLTRTEIRAVNVRKRELLTYQCIQCSRQDASEQSDCQISATKSDLGDLRESILSALLEKIQPLFDRLYDDLGSRIDEGKAEVVMLKESNIQLVHMLNPRVKGPGPAANPCCATPVNNVIDLSEETGGLDSQLTVKARGPDLDGTARAETTVSAERTDVCPIAAVVDGFVPARAGLAKNQNIQKNKNQNIPKPRPLGMSSFPQVRDPKRLGPDPSVSERRSRIVGRNSECGIKAVKPVCYLHICKLHPNTTTEELTEYLKGLFPEVSVSKLDSKFSHFYASFKVRLNSENFAKAMNPELWPDNAMVREFFHRASGMSKSKRKNSKLALRGQPSKE